MLVPWLAAFDLRVLLSRFKEPFDFSSVEARCDDYVILVPIFNDLAYLKNVSFLSAYGERVVLCTTSQESNEFYDGLEAIAIQHDFRIAVVDLDDRFGSAQKNPWAILSKSVVGHDGVLRGAVRGLTEQFVVFLDADTTIDFDLSVACGAMIEQDIELASVRVLPSERRTVVQRLQGIEYDLAMDSRRVYPWLTSGAGMIALTSAMAHILQNHSLFFNGGDIEIGKLANMMGKRVSHLPVPFLTDVPPTFLGWVNQRRSWMCGAFRHCVINADHMLRYPGHFLYYFFLLYVLLPFKWVEMVTVWHLLPVVYCVYVMISLAIRWKDRSWVLLLFPLYALFQATVIIWLGAFRYVRYARATANYGRIRVGRIRNRHRDVLRRNFYSTVRGYVINAAFLIAVFALIKFSIGHLPI